MTGEEMKKPEEGNWKEENDSKQGFTEFDILLLTISLLNNI